MPWGPAPTFSLTIPSDAGPNDPAIIIGNDIPPEIITFYGTSRVVAIIMFRQNSQDYICFALIDPVAGRSFVDVIGQESVGLLLSVANRWKMGTFGADTSVEIFTNIFTIAQGVLFNAGTFAGAAGTIMSLLGFTDINPANAPITVGGDNDFHFDGVSAPRGRRGSTSSTSNSAAIGTTETAVLTITNQVWKADRAYRVFYGPAITASLSTNVGTHRIRKTNAAGALWGGTPAYGPSGAPPTIAAEGFFMVRRNTGSDLTATVVLTLQASSAGTVTQIGANPSARFLTVEDVGAAADFPEAFAVT